LAGVLATEPYKNLGPLLISATVEASDWKIGTQHELRFTSPNNF